jgi:hypothetical protein
MFDCETFAHRSSLLQLPPLLDSKYMSGVWSDEHLCNMNPAKYASSAVSLSSSATMLTYPSGCTTTSVPAVQLILYRPLIRSFWSTLSNRRSVGEQRKHREIEKAHFPSIHIPVVDPWKMYILYAEVSFQFAYTGLNKPAVLRLCSKPRDVL